MRIGAIGAVCLMVGGGVAAQPTGTSKVLDSNRLRAEVGPDGRWRSFAPAWSRSSWLSGGRIAVLVGQDNIVDLVDVPAESLRPNHSVANLPAVSDGVRNGSRYPLDPDDDGDGRANEDRLDGLDNDGDGKVDEDFAAVGDQMVVVAFRVDGNAPKLDVYESWSVWSLPHINTMTAGHVTVRNISSSTYHGIRPGFVASVLSTEDVRAVSMPLPLSMARNGWSATAGVARGDEPIGVVVLTRSEGNNTNGRVRATANGMEVSSPAATTLAPGQELEFFVAIVALDNIKRVNRTMRTAALTLLGDAQHRLVPPPVSITRRTVRGTYRSSVAGDAPTIELRSLQTQGIRARDIVSLGGVSLRSAVVRERTDGVTAVEFPGGIPAELRDATGSLHWAGETESGQVFSVELEPVSLMDVSAQSADAYWAAAGRLDAAWLSGSPNPFRDATTIFYEIPGQFVDENGAERVSDGAVATSVKVYNVAGRLVSTLVDDVKSPGRYNISWDARDSYGTSVASGVYYVKLQIGKRFVTKRLTQLK